jgi:hypothetical protein
MSETPSSLIVVLEAARGMLQTRRAEASDRVERIKAAADLYLSAMEQEIALEFALRNGLPLPLRVDGITPQPKPLRAALDLRSIVETLPELRIRMEPSSPMAAATMSAPAHSQPNPNAPAAIEGGRADEPKSEARPRDGRSLSELDSEVSALIRDMQVLGFDAMPLPLFRAYAEELAARARSLQNRGPEAEELTSRVIRRLTAMAYEKGIGDVYGLNRKHSGDWDELAARARARREDLLAAPTKPKSPVPDAPKSATRTDAVKVLITDTEKLEAFKISTSATLEVLKQTAEAEPASAPESEPVSARLPLLTAACERGPVVMIGGIVKQDKIQAIRERFGIDVEWIDTSRSGNNTIGSVEKRIREKRLAAVVVLQGLISHKHFEPLVGAARQVGLPFAYADKAGMGSVSRAFTEIERAMARKEELAS